MCSFFFSEGLLVILMTNIIILQVALIAYYSYKSETRVTLHYTLYTIQIVVVQSCVPLQPEGQVDL